MENNEKQKLTDEIKDAAANMVRDTVKDNPKIILIVAAIIVGVILLVGLTLFIGFKIDWGRYHENEIEKTANVISQIKNIGELTTACYYEEMAIREFRYDTIKSLKNNNSTKKETSQVKQFFNKVAEKVTGTAAKVTRSSNEILLIGKGKVRAGFNLSKLNDNDLSIRNDTLFVTLSSPEIFDIIMNPSDFSTEYEKGEWSHELTKPIKEAAKKKLEQNAINNGILDKANESGVKKLTEMFKTFGFTEVIVNVAEDRI